MPSFVGFGLVGLVCLVVNYDYFKCYCRILVPLSRLISYLYYYYFESIFNDTRKLVSNMCNRVIDH